MVMLPLRAYCPHCHRPVSRDQEVAPAPWVPFANPLMRTCSIRSRSTHHPRHSCRPPPLRQSHSRALPSGAGGRQGKWHPLGPVPWPSDVL